MDTGGSHFGFEGGIFSRQLKCLFTANHEHAAVTRHYHLVCLLGHLTSLNPNHSGASGVRIHVWSSGSEASEKV